MRTRNLTPPFVAPFLCPNPRRRRFPVAGKYHFLLDAVGSSGDLTEELQAHPCVASRYVEGLHLE